MIESSVTIGGRTFRVVVDENQVEDLRKAASRLDEFAGGIVRTNPHIDSQYLLLMSGMMLASTMDNAQNNDRRSIDRIRELENEIALVQAKLRSAEGKVEALQKQIEELEQEAKDLSETAVKSEMRAKRVQTLEEELLTLRARLDRPGVDGEQKARIETLTQENRELRQILDTREAEGSKLAAAIGRLENFLEAKARG